MSVTKNKELVAIAVVDDDFSVCELVSRHINTLDKCKVVFKAVSGEQLLEKLKLNAEINIIILDIMMDGMNGYDVAKLVRKEYPDIRILFYTMCKTDLAFELMAKYGGHGVIKKGGGVAQFADAIKTVLEGYYFFHDKKEKIKISEVVFWKNKNQVFKKLTSIDIEFLKLLGTDKTYIRIASDLEINERKADYIRQALFELFNTKSRAALALIAFQSGLFSVNEIEYPL